MTKHSVVYDFTLAEPYPPITAKEPSTLPEPLADRIERIAREWGHDWGAGGRTTHDLQCELLEIADEVRAMAGELTILQRPKRTAMASWRRMIRAMKK